MTTTYRPAGRSVGSSHVRIEGRDKVTGRARYSADFPYEGLAHGWLVLSTIARGRVRAVDSSAALELPGVLEVLHHGNATRLDSTFVIPLLGGPPDPTVALFQDDRVHFAGWPVALVVAETAEQAREGAEALTVEYDEEDHDVTFSADRPELAPVDSLHGPGLMTKGDLDAELAESVHVVDAEYTTPQEHHAPMEPHAATARWEGGRLELIDSNQGSSFIAENLAKLFMLSPEDVRVRAENVGGGFGSKGMVNIHHVASAMAAGILGRPVRVVLTRRQMFAVMGYRSATIQRVRLGADADGRLRAVGHRVACSKSTLYPYVEAGTAVTRVLYDAAAHHTSNEVVSLDVPTPTFMRSPGETPGAFALECAMDELAEMVGIDPIELRVRNEPERGPLSGLPFGSRNLIACFREGAGRFGWADRDPRPGVRRDGQWLVGTGTAAATHLVMTLPSAAAVTAEADGTFTARIAAVDIGTGARTALTLVTAEALGVEPGRVTLHLGDSSLPPAALAVGSAGTRAWGWALKMAVAQLKEQLLPGVEIPAEGVTAIADTTAAMVDFMQSAPKERHSYGAHFAEVAVNTVTGEVRVRRMLGVFDCGRIINPLTARSQFLGGMTWGISMALHERAEVDRVAGRPVALDFASYHIASHSDIQDLEAIWIDDPDPDDPVGINGIGEIGNVGPAAAIANAVWHATGVRHRQLPIVPARVLLASI